MAEPTKLPTLTQKEKELRAYYEGSLFRFMQYVNPGYVYGDIHQEAALALENGDNEHFLMLLPRGHLKSHILACYAAWMITKKPWITMVYLTAGDDLAKLQISAIKQMLESDEYRLLWPEMFHKRKSMRDKWATWAINTDHPERKKRRIRDYTLIIKTVGSSATGLHCDVLLLDDIVVQTNAYTDAGRKDVEDSVADFIAIKNTGAVTRAVGTLYHEKDVWHQFMEAELPTIDPETGEQTGAVPQWTVMKREVETKGDGLGEFLWPRTRAPETGEWYGFDVKELAKKKAEYVSVGKLVQFFAQYYNNTNHNPDVMTSEFQYYNRKFLTRVGSIWYYGDKKLNVVAGMDLAWTDAKAKSAKKADYTAIAVIGIDDEGFIYLLDLVQFQTDKYSVYYRHISKLYDMWRFKHIHIESDGAGKLIADQMTEYVRNDGLHLTVKAKAVPRNMSKEERHMMILEPVYAAGTIKHYKGGWMADLEKQLKEMRSKNDDLKDAVCTAVKNAKKPTVSTNHIGLRRGQGQSEVTGTESRIASRFGGRRR